MYVNFGIYATFLRFFPQSSCQESTQIKIHSIFNLSYKKTGRKLCVGWGTGSILKEGSSHWPVNYCMYLLVLSRLQSYILPSARGRVDFRAGWPLGIQYCPSTVASDCLCHNNLAQGLGSWQWWVKPVSSNTENHSTVLIGKTFIISKYSRSLYYVSHCFISFKGW